MTTSTPINHLNEMKTSFASSFEICLLMGVSGKVMGIMRGMNAVLGQFELPGDHPVGKMNKAVDNHMMKSVATSGFIKHSADV
jgi:hypothetical protein